MLFPIADLTRCCNCSCSLTRRIRHLDPDWSERATVRVLPCVQPQFDTQLLLMLSRGLSALVARIPQVSRVGVKVPYYKIED
jgi:hypothetical protein